MTIDDIKGFLQFPANFKEYLLRFSLGYVPSRGGVLLSLCDKFTMPTSDWARYHQHRVQQYQNLSSHLHSFHVTLQRSFPDQDKFTTSLKAVWESMQKPFLALFNFHRYCFKMDSSFLRYNIVCHHAFYISL